MDHQWEDGDADTFWIPPFMVFCLVCLWSTISPFSLRHVVFLNISHPFHCILFSILPSLCLPVPPPSLSWLTWVGETGQFVLLGSKITCLSVWMWRSPDDCCSPIGNRGSSRSKSALFCRGFCTRFLPKETQRTVGTDVKVCCVNLSAKGQTSTAERFKGQTARS